VLSVAQQNSFARHMFESQQQGQKVGSAINEFAAEYNLSESTLTRLWKALKPEFKRLRDLEAFTRWLIKAGLHKQ
jgi:DNA-binding MurR/RpiR family transcriptional regulator